MYHVFCWIMYVPPKNDSTPSAQQLEHRTARYTLFIGEGVCVTHFCLALCSILNSIFTLFHFTV